MTIAKGDDLSLVEASQALAQSWEKTWRQVLCQTLQGEKRNGRWMVTRSSVEKLAEQRAAERRSTTMA